MASELFGGNGVRHEAETIVQIRKRESTGMMTKYKNFAELERDIREEFDPLLSVWEVRSIIGCSAEVVMKLIRAGHLDAYSLAGEPMERERVSAGMQGLRITPSSLRSYLAHIKVK
jgi:hypothetical protein